MNIGDIYESNSDGLVQIIDYEGAYKVKIKFLDTGSERYSQAVDIRLGRCKDRMKPSLWGVGYVGYGRHKTKSIAGRKWIAMMRRCYDKKWKKLKPSYDGVTVCKDWHNFQNFADWFYKNLPYGIENVDLDKDKKGGKIYSPDSCVLISHAENVGLTSTGGFTMRSPLGEIIFVENAKNFCRENGLDRSNLTKVIKGKQSHVKGWKFEDFKSR